MGPFPEFTEKENERLAKVPNEATLRDEMIRCGRHNCVCHQPFGAKHGLYVYAYWYEWQAGVNGVNVFSKPKRVLKRVYIGKSRNEHPATEPIIDQVVIA